MFLPVRISSTGTYSPLIRESAPEFDAQQGWEPGTSKKMGGVDYRGRANAGETHSMMASAAIEAAAPDTARIDRLVCTSIMPEQPIPTTATLIARRLGLNGHVSAYDINASCIGYLLAMESAATAITCGTSSCAAIVAVERATHGLNNKDKSTAFLFGDGAAATIVEKSDGSSGILAIQSKFYPEAADLCEIRAGGARWNILNPPPSPEDYLFRMDGIRLAKLAMNHLPDFIEDTLEKAGILLEDISCIIPHQASSLGLKFLKKWAGSRCPAVVDIISTHGNQVSASMPTALDHAIKNKMLERGQSGMMVGTAAGFGMGCMIFRH